MEYLEFICELELLSKHFMNRGNIYEILVYSPNEEKYISGLKSIDEDTIIHCKIEKENPYDDEAILIYTLDSDKNIIKIGYIQKKIFVGKDENDLNIYDYLFFNDNVLFLEEVREKINDNFFTLKYENIDGLSCKYCYLTPRK